MDKLAEEREALGGRVFDVLGRVFDDYPLRDLLMEAIRYGEKEEVRDRLYQVLDQALDRKHLRRLLEERALATEAMDATRVQKIREDMERAAARRLQPHFIRSFFMEAFNLLGGTVREREPGRYEITHVPAVIRQRDRLIGCGSPVLSRYERVCFGKNKISLPGYPPAAFLCPGHPLLDATIDLIRERYRDLLKKGTVLIDPDDAGRELRVLFCLEHSIQDGCSDRSGQRRVVSRQMQFVEMKETGGVSQAGFVCQGNRTGGTLGHGAGDGF